MVFKQHISHASLQIDIEDYKWHPWQIIVQCYALFNVKFPHHMPKPLMPNSVESLLEGNKVRYSFTLLQVFFSHDAALDSDLFYNASAGMMVKGKFL